MSLSVTNTTRQLLVSHLSLSLSLQQKQQKVKLKDVSRGLRMAVCTEKTLWSFMFLLTGETEVMLSLVFNLQRKPTLSQEQERRKQKGV